MKTIIKAQRGLNNPGHILIYNQDRSVNQEFDNNLPLSLAIGDKYKCYFEVNIDDDGLMHIEREVKAKW